MMFRNSVRILLTNFSNVWKLLLYYIICTTIAGLICWPIVSPVVIELSKANVFSDFWNLLNSAFYNPGGLPYGINDVLDVFISVISQNSPQFMMNYILFGFIVIFIYPFMLSLGSLPMGDVLYGFMTSQVRYGYTGSYIRNLGKSCVFCLVKILFILPLNILILLSLYLMIKLAVMGSIGYILLDILLFVVIAMLIALKVTLYNCWMPAVAVLDVGPFKALKIGFRAVFRKFGNIYSTAITFVLTAIAVNLAIGLFTFTIGLIITVPLTIFGFMVFQMVAYFTSQGMRFYVYPDMFISPKKFEEQDTIKKIKFIV